MKVLQIINSLGTGGAEKLLLDTIPLYRKAGIEMDVLVFWNNNHQFLNSLKALDCCKVIILKQSVNYKDIYSLSHVWQLRKYLKEYDIAHVHLFPAQYYTVLANQLLRKKCKLIFTEHNTTNRRMESSILGYLDRLMYKGFEKIICITEDVCLQLKKHLKTSLFNISIIENGVNLDEVTQAVSVSKKELLPSFQSGDKILLQVGGFRLQKDQETTITALLYLPINFHLILVGDGERRKYLENVVLKFNLHDRVHFLGARNDVFSILKSVDYVVVSSHWEGFGLVAVEGMAANKPVLASNVVGLSQVIKGAGILFRGGDYQELAQKILELNDSNTLYRKTVGACTIRASQYDIYKMIDKHISLYKNVYEV